MEAITYRAEHKTQRIFSDPYRNYNCAAYAFAMFVDRVTMGGIDISGRTVRALTNEPIPDPRSPGLRLEQLDTVAAKLRIHFVPHRGDTFSELRAWVNQGRGALVNGDRDALGDQPCADPFLGLHSVFVHAIFPDGDWLVSDPLCTKMGRVDAARMKRYAEKYGQQAGLGTGRINFALTRPTPKVVA